jgi:hypothetical protein
VGENIMLSQTVRNNLKEIQNYTMRNKTTKYSNLFSTNPTIGAKDSKFKQLLMKDGLIKVDENDELYKELRQREEELSTNLANTIDENEDLIVENPEEVVVNFSDFVTTNLEEKLPFFKSISLKLSQMYN